MKLRTMSDAEYWGGLSRNHREQSVTRNLGRGKGGNFGSELVNWSQREGTGQQLTSAILAPQTKRGRGGEGAIASSWE